MKSRTALGRPGQYDEHKTHELVVGAAAFGRAERSMDPTRCVSPHKRRADAVSIRIVITRYQLDVGRRDVDATLIGM
jgi:hypothetical protein